MENSPHFFKIILPNTLQDGKLEIPKKFVRKHGEALSNSAFLKLPSGGGEWEVGLTRHDDGCVSLQNGWKEFAMFCSLKYGHLVCFEYEGNSRFSVLILNETATEIDYPSNISHGDQEGNLDDKEILEVDDDSSVEILGDFPPCPKTREKSPSPLPCGPCLKLQKKSKITPNFHSTEQKFKAKEEVKGISTTEPGLKSEVLRRTNSLADSEKARALQKASAFKSENPHFVVVMQPSYVHLKSSLNLPIWVARRYLKKRHGEVILWVSDGRKWTVDYSSRLKVAKPKGSFLCGWSAFAQDNSLEVGDICVFELIKGVGLSFKVIIFRATEENCSVSLANGYGVNQVDPKRISKVKTEHQGTQSNGLKAEKLKGKMNAQSFEGGSSFVKEEGGGGMTSNTPRCPQTQIFRRMESLTASEKARAHERATTAFHSENPSFIVAPATITRSWYLTW